MVSKLIKGKHLSSKDINKLRGFANKSTICEQLCIHDSEFDVSQKFPIRHRKFKYEFLIPPCFFTFHYNTKLVTRSVEY